MKIRIHLTETRQCSHGKVGYLFCHTQTKNASSALLGAFFFIEQSQTEKELFRILGFMAIFTAGQGCSRWRREQVIVQRAKQLEDFTKKTHRRVVSAVSDCPKSRLRSVIIYKRSLEVQYAKRYTGGLVDEQDNIVCGIVCFVCIVVILVKIVGICKDKKGGKH